MGPMYDMDPRTKGTTLHPMLYDCNVNCYHHTATLCFTQQFLIAIT